jgi:Family of unknown function (DUF6368)
MGPSVDIPLRDPLSTAQARELAWWLELITVPLEGEPLDWWPFWIRDDHNIEVLPIDDCSESCAFGLNVCNTPTEQDSVGEDGTVDPEILAEFEEERAQTVNFLGYYPKQSINLFAGCNKALDHRILGYLALQLAERYDGIIDMNGAITPPVHPGGYYPFGNYPWHTLEEISAFVHAMPGRVLERYYTVSPDRRWVSHMVDTTFMRAWLEHPHFHMIK